MENLTIRLEIASPLHEEVKKYIKELRLDLNTDLEIQSEEENDKVIKANSSSFSRYLSTIDEQTKRSRQTEPSNVIVRCKYFFSDLFLRIVADISIGKDVKLTITIPELAKFVNDINRYINLENRTIAAMELETTLRKVVTNLPANCLPALLIACNYFSINFIPLYSFNDLNKYAENQPDNDWVDHLEPLLESNKSLLLTQLQRYKVFFLVLMIAYHKCKSKKDFVIKPTTMEILLQIVPMVEYDHVEEWFDIQVYGNPSGPLATLIHILFCSSLFTQRYLGIDPIMVIPTPQKRNIDEVYLRLVNKMKLFEESIKKRQKGQTVYSFTNPKDIKNIKLISSATNITSPTGSSVVAALPSLK